MHVRGQKTITDCYEVIVMKTVMKMKACYSGLVFPGQERILKSIQYLDPNCFLLLFWTEKLCIFTANQLYGETLRNYSIYVEEILVDHLGIFFTVNTSILYSCFILIQVDILCLFRHFSM